MTLFRSGSGHYLPRPWVCFCTLQALEKEDTLSFGLLTKMHTPKFVGCIYIFQYVVPILNQINKTFQQGAVNFGHIGPAVEHAEHKL